MKKSQNLCWNSVSDGAGFDGEPRRERKSDKSPPPSRNPFFNFLRELRKSNSGMANTQLTKQGAKIWRQMNEDQKLLYFELAKSAPTRKKKEEMDGEICKARRGRSRSRRSKSRKRSKSRTRSRSARAADDD